MTSMFNCLAKLLHLKASKDNRAEFRKEEHAVEQPTTIESWTRLETSPNEVPEAAESEALIEAPASPPTKPVPSIVVRKSTVDLGTPNKASEPQITVAIPRSPPENEGIIETTPTQSLTPHHSRRNSGESSSSNLSRSDSGGSKSVHWLKEQLENARLECPMRHHSFIVPKDVQESLITESTIAEDIQARSPDISEKEARDYAKTACQHARCLYATLAYIKRGADICALLNEGITDEDLPLVRKPNDRTAPLYLRRGDLVLVKTMKTWKPKHRENFDRVQWWMTSPLFKYGEHYSLDEKAVLPFVSLDANEASLGKKQGGYSEVYPVRIHPAHHDFWETTGQEKGPLVAVKQLFSSDETEFQKECTILQALNPKGHPHLIKLLATYEMGNKYHLMFPYADANLRKYWEDHPNPTFNADTVLWSLRQMAGIASGLQLIHDFKVTVPLSVPGVGIGDIRVGKGKGAVQLEVQNGEQWFGRHGDIKPENVLWFAKDHSLPYSHSMGVLQIADFGLGRFHGRDSRSRVDPETIISSPTYEPPECKMKLPVSRAYDIWSLGCIYLEFITWLLRGSSAIDGFADFRGRDATDSGINEDNFFTITMEDGVLKASVREKVSAWSEELHSDKNCSNIIHDLLKLTMSDLLVIESENRSKASWLCIQLKKLLKRAETDPEYLLKPIPRKPASERSNSAPVLGPPKANEKRNSVTFLDQEKSHPPKSQFKVHITTTPKDLVLRNLGTPSFKVQNLGKKTTWNTI
ncbi:kinase-like protein [Stipitochalara longipes BDJ]|nr:kinase-like protein [Stipitochalara longipes BDJ]